MGAWKKVNGGAVADLGTSIFSTTGIQSTEVVSAAANANGVIIHAAMIASMSSSLPDYLLVNGYRLLGARGNTVTNSLTPIFVPPGENISIQNQTAADVVIRYTIL